MTRLLAVALVWAAAGPAACGGGGDSGSPPPKAPAGATAASGTGATGIAKRKGRKTSSRPSVLAPKPGLPALSGQQQKSFAKARAACASQGVRGIARRYGSGSRNPVLLARAYAGRAFDPGVQQAAFEGCVAGFR